MTGNQLRKLTPAKTPALEETEVTEVTEAQLQAQCEQYLRTAGLRYIHIPGQLQRFILGSGFRNTKTGKQWRVVPIHIAKLASDAFKGQPDLLVFGTDGRYLAVELKVGRNKLTTEQEQWTDYGLHVCRSFEAFQQIVSDWILEGEK
jgi:hypothetical protein